MINSLLDELKKLNLPPNQYAIYGSGPMGIRKIKEINDLDIVVKNDLYKKLLEKHKETKLGCLSIGKIEIYPARNALIDNPDEVIDRSETIDGYKFITLKDLIDWKRKMGREKDLKDIELIEEYLGKN
jgi:hypothetical protein